MDDRIENAASAIDEVATDAAETFGGLDIGQLNWKPSPKSWSAAQCFDHLITINTLYFPLFERMRSDKFPNTFWERHSPFSAALGRYFIKILSPTYNKNIKTTTKGYPSTSEIDSEIMRRFGEHQQQLAGHIRHISPQLDLNKTIITSPLLSIITYSLADALTMLTVHERRHFLQAKRVMSQSGFPGRGRG